MTADPRLAEVEDLAAHLQVIRRNLELAIRNAREDGASLREIAKAAGVSYETVRRITTS